MNKIFLTITVLLILCFDYSFAQDETNLQERPNIIFTSIDDMGYADFSSYGNKEIETPNIDRLANEGTKFTNAYVAYPICSPARVSVMTGQ
jgi:arylsulfatase A-like enzyme